MRSDLRLSVILLALLFTLVPGLGRAAEGRPDAVLTEVRHGVGAVLVHKAGQAAPRPAEPLMIVAAEDKVIVRGDARAVVLLPNGATKTVTSATSPLVVPAVDDEPGELRGALTRLYALLKGAPPPRMWVQMGTRTGKPGGGAASLVRFLPDAVFLDWRARQGAYYEVSVAGDEGARWTHTRGVPPLTYPDDAPPLVPGTVYEFRVRSNQAIIEHSFFEVASEEEQNAVRAELAELDALPAPPVTRALLRASYLAAARFLPSARRELEAAVEAHPGDASLRSMLASVYVSLGRGDLAEKERRVAKALTRLTVK
jgi:hypothetical protein